MLRIFYSLFVLSCGFVSAAENASLKMVLNMPVFYQLHVEGDVTTDGKDPRINFKSFNMDIDFSVIVKNEHEQFPELIITPTKLAGLLKFNQGSAVFDLSKENLTFNHILADSFPVLNSIKLNQPIRVPITDNVDFLSGQHQNYPILPIGRPEAYANLSKKILDFIANGMQVKQGRARARIPELGLEIFSNEKNVEDQFKGDYTLRFFMPLGKSKNGCTESLVGGGKIKNSTLATHILHTRAQGIFLLLFQKMDCPSKEMNERHEVRGKLSLTPKTQALSPLT